MDRSPPPNETLARALSLRAAASEAPARAAIVDRFGTYSYTDLAEEAARLARALRARGVACGSRVAFVARPERSVAVLIHALIELGAVAVPMHPRWTVAERRALVERVGPRLVIPTEAEAKDSSLAVAALTAAATASGGETFPAASDRAPRLADPMAIVHTSGSSGVPKGVVLSRRAFAAAALASGERLGVAPDDRWFLSLPPAHVGGLSIFLRMLAARRTVVLHDAASFDATAARDAMERHAVTLASLVPTMLARFVEQERSPPASLRAVLVGGAGAPRGLLPDAAALGWPVLPTYGLTETCAQVATLPPSEENAARLADAGVVGPPLPGVEIRIAGGEIQVRGLQLMTSWYPPDALSSPWTDDGWLRTGDRGALDERGWLVVRGRRDELIVSGGENVDPNEVSSVLSGHPAVREACVVGVPDVRWGQRVVAVIERVRGASLDAEGLRSYLRDRLATFKCPREIHVVAELPRTESGKVDRKAVARRAGSRHGGSMPG